MFGIEKLQWQKVFVINSKQNSVEIFLKKSFPEGVRSKTGPAARFEEALKKRQSPN